MTGRTVSAATASPGVDALRDDPYIGPRIDRIGPLRVEPADALFPRLIRSICRQQVSMAVADTIYERLADRVTLEPEVVRDTDPAVLRDVGLSRRKAETVRAVADAVAAQGLSKAALADASDATIRSTLTDIHGVGPWTADMALIFVFDRPDVLPLGDLGVRRELRALFDDPDLDREALRENASRWRPHRTTATLYLWAEE